MTVPEKQHNYGKGEDDVRLRGVRTGNGEVGGQVPQLWTVEHDEGV